MKEIVEFVKAKLGEIGQGGHDDAALTQQAHALVAEVTSESASEIASESASEAATEAHAEMAAESVSNL